MRLLPSPSILAGVATALLLATACSQATSQAASFEGTELDPVRAATGFQLHDQFENRLSLSDLAGKVVILTFLYTNCPDICPVITETLKRAHTQLGDDADDVRLVAGSVDPERDTVEQAHRYSERSGMLDRWAFLVGTEDELTPIWSAYYIAAQRQGIEEGGGALDRLDDEADSHTDADIAELAYLVTHSSAAYLIDRQGRLRVLFTELSLDPEPLLHDIRLLL
ncbi:MAG: SCO family protein [Chloroflexi bacterium]|nr:SCO family protein [Chloroflexota bacterium]